MNRLIQILACLVRILKVPLESRSHEFVTIIMSIVVGIGPVGLTVLRHLGAKMNVLITFVAHLCCSGYGEW